MGKDNKDVVRVWAAKYAMSSGEILSFMAEIKDGGYARQVLEDRRTMDRLFLSRTEYSLTEEDARQQAEELRIKKLKSLDKQTKKVSGLVFTVKEL